MTMTDTKYRLKIIQDHDPEAPRPEDGSTFVTWHQRYTIGDEQPDQDPLDYMLGLLPDDIQEQIEQEIEEYEEQHAPQDAPHSSRPWAKFYAGLDKLKADRIGEEFDKLYLYLPVFAYEHGGITISTGGFSCPWDSGQLGFIYVSKEDVAKEWSCDEEKAAEYLKGEIEVYDQYLQGQVYGFVLYEVQTCNLGHEHLTETGDSCWGFYCDSWKDCRDEMSEHFEPKFTDEEWQKAWEERDLGY